MSSFPFKHKGHTLGIALELACLYAKHLTGR